MVVYMRTKELYYPAFVWKIALQEYREIIRVAQQMHNEIILTWLCVSHGPVGIQINYTDWLSLSDCPACVHRSHEAGTGVATDTAILWKEQVECEYFKSQSAHPKNIRKV